MKIYNINKNMNKIGKIYLVLVDIVDIIYAYI